VWRFRNPVAVTFGSGCIAEAGNALAGRSYALVTYGEPLFESLTGRLIEIAGHPQTIINDIPSNPDFEALGRCCASLRQAGPEPEALLALGGGSVIDAAKVLATSGGDFETVRHHLETGQASLSSDPIPIIALPTTAGTGSEVTCWATVWDKGGGRKHSLARPSLYPEQALVDPELTHDVPLELTISTALDALSHALEAIWNRQSNPVSTQLACRAAREILSALPSLARDLENRTLRERVSRAALMAGMAFSNTRTALAHSISYPVTLHHGVPHGLACSFTLPMVMRGVVGEDPICDAALADIFGANLEAGAQHLTHFLDDLGVSRDATSYGMTRDEFRNLIMAAFDGERGRNFIGRRERVLAAECEGVA
jgi:alcohol dehydrogenase